MANALRAINTRVNALQKRHPKTKRTTLQKQAGREWKAGKLSGKRKRKPAKHKKVRRVSVRSVGARPKPHRRKRSTKKRAVRVIVLGAPKKTRKRRRYKPVKVTHCRRVGSKKSMVNPLILLAGGALLLYAFTRPGVLSPTLPPVTLTNPAAASSANNLISIATAAGATIPAITKLINSLNSSPAEAVISANNGVTSGGMTIDQLLND